MIIVLLDGSNKKPAASRSRSLQDKKFETSVEAKRRRHSVSISADAILNVVERVVKEPKKLDRDERHALNDVTNTIVLVLRDFFSFISSFANLQSSIGGLNYVY